MKRKYTVADGRTLDFDKDTGQVRSPVSGDLTDVNIFDDDEKWTGESCPWLVFDCDTGEVVDWSPTHEIASETIISDEMWNGIEIPLDQANETKNQNEAYKRAMDII